MKAKKGLRPKFFITFCERFFIQLITKIHTARKEKFSIKGFFSNVTVWIKYLLKLCFSTFIRAFQNPKNNQQCQ